MSQQTGLQPRQPALAESDGATLYAMLDFAIAADAENDRTYAESQAVAITDPAAMRLKQVWLAASNAHLIAWHTLAHELATAGDPVLERGGMRYWRTNGTYSIARKRA